MIELSAKDIADQLSLQVHDVVQHLLGMGGKQEGREMLFGDVSGSEGRSLKVCVDGTKRGVWADFATGEAGDLLDLWRVVNGITMAEAIRQAKDYLGIKTEAREKLASKREYRRPEKPAAKRMAETSAQREYLLGRGLTEEAIAAYQVAEIGALPSHLKKGKQADWLVFPFKRENELLGVKYLNVKRDAKGKKEIISEGGCEPILFGWQAIPEDVRYVVLTEGELDAMSMFVFGFPALSVPFGGGKGMKQQWIESEFEHLARFDIIYLALDNDEEGHVAMKEIASRLGQHRCRVVELPKKDANECLTEGVPKDYIAACLEEATTYDPEELRSIKDYGEAIEEYFYPTAGERPGFDLPWGGNKLRIHFGELSLWTGFNGHGKSVLLGQVVNAATTAGQKACIASFEMRPEATFGRMMRQMTGSRVPSRQAIQRITEDYADVLWTFGLQGTGKLKRLLEVFEYGYRRYGIRQFVIDSLMKLGIAEDDYNAQKDAVEQLTDFCHEFDVSVHLVAHARKQMSEENPPRKMDVKGGGSITDLVDNVFVVWRNKNKEAAQRTIIQNPAMKTQEAIATLLSQGDAQLIMDKCRDDGEREGTFDLAFDPDSLRYTDFYLAGATAPPPDDGDMPQHWQEDV